MKLNYAKDTQGKMKMQSTHIIKSVFQTKVYCIITLHQTRFSQGRSQLLAFLTIQSS